VSGGKFGHGVGDSLDQRQEWLFQLVLIFSFARVKPVAPVVAFERAKKCQGGPAEIGLRSLILSFGIFSGVTLSAMAGAWRFGLGYGGGLLRLVSPSAFA
jgi:hypothetical protein